MLCFKNNVSEEISKQTVKLSSDEVITHRMVPLNFVRLIKLGCNMNKKVQLDSFQVLLHYLRILEKFLKPEIISSHIILYWGTSAET